MKNKRALEIDRHVSFRAYLEKHSLTKPVVGFWRDLEDDQRWKYDRLFPLQLLETLKLDEHPADQDELARAEFFWSRRPRFLSATASAAWFIVALGLPLWIIIAPAIGLALLTVCAVLVNTEVVRSVRWRRQYELSIDRLVRNLDRSPHS